MQEWAQMKTVLITGCSSGFGRRMINEFLERGWCVIATMRNADAHQNHFAAQFSLAEGYKREDHKTPSLTQRKESTSAGAPSSQQTTQDEESRLILLSLDVTNPDHRNAVNRFVQAHGRLDALVNNAGYGLFGALEDLSEDQLRHQMEVNFFGAALLTRSLLPYLRQAQGAIIFISSTFGYLGFPLTSTYCASKFALEGLAESLYYELKPHRVRVALVEPGASRSNFGANIQWGNGNMSVYQAQTQSYHRIRAKLKANAHNLAPIVARWTADLADGRNRSFRTQVGRDGAIAHAVSRLIPEEVRHAVLTRMYQKMFLNQEGP